MSLCPRPPDLSAWVLALAACLDARQHHRFAALVTGLLFARGRRTVTTWLRAGGLAHEFRQSYGLLARVGQRSAWLAVWLRRRAAVPLLAGGQDRLLFGLDDTPTRRYGPKVQGAGIHHNPTPGPAGAKFVYRHVWVTLARLAPHRAWGTIALPLLARLYIRRKDLADLPADRRPAFQTTLQQAADLTAWLVRWLGASGKRRWLAADGAYAKKELPRPARRLGVAVVRRLRKDSALRSLPPPKRPGRRGKPPTYGPDAIGLAKRAGQKRGWQTGEFVLYRRTVTKTFETFRATWPPAGGAIRVVRVQETRGGVATVATDPAATAADILTAVAARSAIEQAYHDLKEVWGVGQPQVRTVAANVGAFHLSLWAYTPTELWAWRRSGRQLVDRTASPWDDPDRRPSQADRRRALQRACLEQEYRATAAGRGQGQKIRRLARRLLKLVA